MKKEPRGSFFIYGMAGRKTLFLHAMLMLLFHLFFGADILLPHGDLDLKIEAISHLIETYPDSMQLRLKRGDYYVQNEEFDKAKQDYLLCFNRHHKTDYVLIGMTTCYLVEGKTDSALYFINQTLLKAPDNPGAKELKAKVFLSAVAIVKLENYIAKF